MFELEGQPSTKRSLQEDASKATLAGSAVLATGLTTVLSACGSAATPATSTAAPEEAVPASSLSAKEASRFLSQAAPGTSMVEITRVQKLGLSEWLDQQFQLPADTGHWDWMVAKGYAVVANKTKDAGIDDSLWRRLMSSPDSLRVRVSLALSEIFVIGIGGLNMPFAAFAAANFMDILERNAFGNWRTLIEEVSKSTAMGVYLSHRGNVKADPVTGQLPDENFAREIMQLFSIGLYELNTDGTPQLEAGNLIEAWDQDDVAGLARVFTGWNYDSTDSDTPERNRRPMTPDESLHETGSKHFLGTTIAANTNASKSLSIALDTLLMHSNCAPFFCRQLIQRLVTSNPSPAYVGRVAGVFNSTRDKGGDLKAVVRAILLDSEARDESLTAQPGIGKVREPMLRFAQWARCFSASSPGDTWKIGSLADPATQLGQSPLRSSSVFNFFRPGYRPPGPAFSIAGLVAPELQLANESTMIGYVNFMQQAIGNALEGLRADYTGWATQASVTQTLLDDLNLILAAGQVSVTTVSAIKSSIDTISLTSTGGWQNRVAAATLLIMACPEFLVQK